MSEQVTPENGPAGDDLVTAAVDVEVCIGVGQCELLAPEVFRVDDDDGMSQVVGDGRLPRAQLEQVIDKCPSGAISIREDSR